MAVWRDGATSTRPELACASGHREVVLRGRDDVQRSHAQGALNSSSHRMYGMCMCMYGCTTNVSGMGLMSVQCSMHGVLDCASLWLRVVAQVESTLCVCMDTTTYIHNMYMFACHVVVVKIYGFCFCFFGHGCISLSSSSSSSSSSLSTG